MEWLFLSAAAAILVWGIVIYNRLVANRNQVLAAWSDIDVQLKRRSDLIPKLVDTVKQYASFEYSLQEQITQLRSGSSHIELPGVRERIENELSIQLRDLVMLAEDYPELKAGENYLALMQELSDVEKHIQLARRFYNGAVRVLNVSIESFPNMYVAQLFGFKTADFFEYTPVTNP